MFDSEKEAALHLRQRRNRCVQTGASAYLAVVPERNKSRSKGITLGRPDGRSHCLAARFGLGSPRAHGRRRANEVTLWPPKTSFRWSE